VLSLTWLIDFVDRLRQRRLDVRLRIHRAWFASDPERGECYFLNLQNLSPEREITVTHVWIASEPPVHATAKQLPARLKPLAQWETWVPVASVPEGTDNVEHLGRARLGDDREVEAVPRTDVPPVGYVPS
jgi:hypothetical protein